MRVQNKKFASVPLVSLILISGCGTVQTAITSAINAGSGNTTKDLPPEQRAQLSRYGGGEATRLSGSLWPVDIAFVPPPKIVLAAAESCDATAIAPISSAANAAIEVNGPNSFSVTVTNAADMGAVQQDLTLCWAACTQTLLRQQAITVDQKQLAKQFVPDQDDEDTQQAAGLGVVTRALNPDLEPQVEQRGAIPISLLPVTSDQVINELMHGKLCIVGLMEDPKANIGHACVICGAKFARLKPSVTSGLNIPFAINPNVPQQPNAENSLFNPVFGLYEITLFDPEPKVGLRKLTAQQFADQTVFITSHQISHDILTDALAAPDTGLANGQLAVKSTNPKRAHAAIASLKKNQPSNQAAVHPGQRSTQNGGEKPKTKKE